MLDNPSTTATRKQRKRERETERKRERTRRERLATDDAAVCERGVLHVRRGRRLTD